MQKLGRLTRLDAPEVWTHEAHLVFRPIFRGLVIPAAGQ